MKIKARRKNSLSFRARTVLIQQRCCHSKHHHTPVTSETSPWKRSVVLREHQHNYGRCAACSCRWPTLAHQSSLSYLSTSNSHATCHCVFGATDSLGPGLTPGSNEFHDTRRIAGDNVAQPGQCPLNATTLSCGATLRVSKSDASWRLSCLRCFRQRGMFLDKRQPERSTRSLRKQAQDTHMGRMRHTRGTQTRWELEKPSGPRNLHLVKAAVKRDSAIMHCDDGEGTVPKAFVKEAAVGHLQPFPLRHTPHLKPTALILEHRRPQPQQRVFLQALIDTIATPVDIHRERSDIRPFM